MTTILEKTAGLVAFVRTVDAGSFSAASRQIGSTPSAVSKSVARLERRLGVRLIQRSTRTLALTPEGCAYYERVAPLLRAIEDAEDVVQKADGAHGVLRVTAAVEIGRTMVGPWARRFAERHPGLKLELNVTDRNVDLIREGYDMALRMGPLPDSDLMGRQLAELETVLVASPSYLKRMGRPRTPADLYKHACLRYLLAGRRPYPIVFADRTSIVGDGPFDADDAGTLRQAAVNGAGIVHLLTMAVEDDFAAGRLVRVLPRHPLTTMPVHLLHAFGRQVPLRVRLFIDFLAGQTAPFAR